MDVDAIRDYIDQRISAWNCAKDVNGVDLIPQTDVLAASVEYSDVADHFLDLQQLMRLERHAVHTTSCLRRIHGKLICRYIFRFFTLIDN